MNKSYQLLWSESAKKDLSKLDKQMAKFIILQTSSAIEPSVDITKVLVPLKYAKKGQHKYRIGNYRVICTLLQHELLVVAIRVGHRKDMYQK